MNSLQIRIGIELTFIILIEMILIVLFSNNKYINQNYSNNTIESYLILIELQIIIIWFSRKQPVENDINLIIDAFLTSFVFIFLCVAFCDIIFESHKHLSMLIGIL